MSEKNIVLYKQRDFGQKLNITIEYIRYNFAPLMKMLLIIVIPMGILSSFFLGNYFSIFGGLVSNPDATSADAVGFMGQIAFTYLGIIVAYMITYSFMVAAVFTYMKAKSEQGSVDYMDALKDSFKYVPGLIGLSILVGIISFIGFFIFIIPGIYFMVVFSISLPIYMFEQQGVGHAFSKCFKLIRDKWWSTFGLMMISSIIAGVASYIFIIPTYVLMLGDMFRNAENLEADPGSFFAMFDSWTATAGMAFSMIGTYLTYCIPIIAIGFQYFNLSERMEGTGLKSQIENFENLS
ncbi:YciC family protein [Marinoscillum sp.]|uniref:YciC family protein n=1 Tax=Marinoscillum sp. TaxID=2024838 RepID=UPI003BAB2311